MLLAARHELPLIQYPTAVAKRAVTGHGGSTKEGVRLMVEQELGLQLDAKEHDATDALAIALCLLHDHRLQPGFA